MRTAAARSGEAISIGISIEYLIVCNGSPLAKSGVGPSVVHQPRVRLAEQFCFRPGEQSGPPARLHWHAVIVQRLEQSRVRDLAAHEDRDVSAQRLTGDVLAGHRL
jgi:hypothetical protein